MKYKRIIEKNEKEYYLDEIIKDKEGKTKGAVYKTLKGVREYFTDWELGINVVSHNVRYRIENMRHENSKLVKDLKDESLWNWYLL